MESKLYLSFCDWFSLSIMSSSFTYMVACVKISFFLKTEGIPLYIDTTFSCPFTH